MANPANDGKGTFNDVMLPLGGLAPGAGTQLDPRAGRNRRADAQPKAYPEYVPGARPPSGYRGIWDIQSINERGAAAEGRLGGRTGLHPNYPVIDRFENGVATSVKTMDLGRKTYQSPQQIISSGQRYIRDVSGFAVKVPEYLAGLVIRPSEVKQRALDLVVPTWATSEQREALQQLVEYGRQRIPPVLVRIVELK